MSCKEFWAEEIAARLATACKVAPSQVDGAQRCDREGCDAFVNRAVNRCVKGHVQGTTAPAEPRPMGLELAGMLCFWEESDHYERLSGEGLRKIAAMRELLKTVGKGQSSAGAPGEREVRAAVDELMSMVDDLENRVSPEELDALGADPRVQAAQQFLAQRAKAEGAEPPEDATSGQPWADLRDETTERVETAEKLGELAPAEAGRLGLRKAIVQSRLLAACADLLRQAADYREVDQDVPVSGVGEGFSDLANAIAWARRARIPQADPLLAAATAALRQSQQYGAMGRDVPTFGAGEPFTPLQEAVEQTQSGIEAAMAQASGKMAQSPVVQQAGVDSLLGFVREHGTEPEDYPRENTDAATFMTLQGGDREITVYHAYTDQQMVQEFHYMVDTGEDWREFDIRELAYAVGMRWPASADHRQVLQRAYDKLDLVAWVEEHGGEIEAWPTEDLEWGELARIGPGGAETTVYHAYSDQQMVLDYHYMIDVDGEMRDFDIRELAAQIGVPAGDTREEHLAVLRHIPGLAEGVHSPEEYEGEDEEDEEAW